MKEESFDLHDKNALFESAEAMHDEVMTHIEFVGNELRIVYGGIGENEYYKPYSKLTITYTLDPVESDLSLTIIKSAGYRTRCNYSMNDPRKVFELNQWNMRMFKFDMDMWGEMTLHFNIDNGMRYRKAELRFAPVLIQYRWEE